MCIMSKVSVIIAQDGRKVVKIALCSLTNKSNARLYFYFVPDSKGAIWMLKA